MSEMTLRQAAREREWWLLGAVIVVLFRRPLTTGTLFFRDIYELFIPNALFLSRSLHAGAFPLWDPRYHGGIPFSSPANSPFYPANVLYALLPPLAAFNVIAVAHVVFASLTSYWLARLLGMGRRAAAVAGAAYALSGVLLSSLNLVPIALALPWVPLTIGRAHAYWRDGRRRELVLGAVSAAMPLLAGAAEVTAMMFGILAAWAAAMKGPSLAKKISAIAFLGFFAAALSLVQLLPGLEMMRSSSRVERRDFQSFSTWSIDPRRLPELVIPQFLGRTDALDEREYWGSALESKGFPYILSIYVGALVILFAVAGAAVPRDGVPRRTLAALALLALAMALGRALPFLRIVFELFPPVAIFRFPVKALIAALVPVALLAGSGFAAMEEGNERAKRIVLIGAGALVVMIAIAGAVASSSFALDTVRQRMLLMRVAQPIVVLMVAVVALRLRRLEVLAVLAVADLAVAGSGVNAIAPRSLFDEPPAARAVRSLDGGGRFTHFPEPFAIDLRAPSDDIRHLARFKLETLDGYDAAAFGIPVVFHVDYDGLAPRPMSRLTDELPRLRWRDRLAIFDVAGVRAFMTTDLLRAPGIVPAFRFGAADGKWRNVYTIPTAAMARFVSRVELVADDAAMLRRVTSGFDPSTLILFGNGAPIAGCGTAPVRGSEVTAPCDGYVLFAQTWNPDWRVRVDAHEAPALRADYAFTAVPVRAGRHVVMREYAPRALNIGLAGSIVALLALIGIAWRS